MKPLWAVLLFLSTALPLGAQNADPQWGLAPYQTFQGSDFDHVNVMTGLVNFSIPLWSYPQRGGKLKYGYSLQYNSKYYTTSTLCDPASPSDCDTYFAHRTHLAWLQTYDQYTHASIESVAVGGFELVPDQGAMMIGDSYVLATTTSTTFSGAPSWRSTFHDSQLVTPDGSAHPYTPLTSGANSLGGQVLSGGLTLDGTGFQGNANGTFDRSGVSSTFNLNTGSQASADADGNTLSNTLDSMGRQFQSGYATTDYTSCTGTLPTTSATVYTVPGANGSTLNYKLCYATVAVSIPGAACNADDLSTSAQFLQSVVLPNQQAWTFEYNARGPSDAATVNFGEVSKITLPTGGTISYSYKLDVFACSVAVYQRTVSDGTASHTWTYTLISDHPGTLDDLGYPFGTVTDPDSNVTATSFNGYGYEAVSREYSGTSTLLRRTDTAYTAGVYPLYPIQVSQSGGVVNVLPQSVTTTLANGLVSKKVFSYCCDYSFTGWGMGGTTSHGSMVGGGPITETASYGIKTGEQDYDYGQGAPGALLKSTQSTFLWQSNPNYFIANLLDTPTVSAVKDGNGTTVSQTSYAYDESASVGISSGMTSSYQLNAPAIAGVFGHVTTTTHWLSGGASPQSHATYYDTGEVASTTDALGNSTSFTYAADYWGALPTTITNALNQHASYTYDLNSGQRASVTDANQNTSSWVFDNLGRVITALGPTDAALNARPTTSVCYDDTPGNCQSDSPLNAIVVTQSVLPGVNMVTEHRSDALGRDIGTRLLSDPDGTTYTLKTYDELGRVFEDWNPSRCPLSSATTSCPGESTFGITSHYYDSLGRETTTVPPDGTTASNNIRTTYTGNATTVVDQANVSKTATSDALGRLTQVSEDNVGWITQYQYDTLGNLLCVEQHGGIAGTGCSANSSNDSTSPWRVRRFTYDSMSRLITSNNPETGTITYSYDANSNLVSKTDAAGITINYSPSASPIDALNRVTEKTYSNGDAPVSYAYDSTNLANGIGRLTNITDASGQTRLGYDAVGRQFLKRQILPGVATKKTTGWFYDLMGGIREVDDAAGGQTSYTPTAAGRTSAVADIASGNVYIDGLHYTPGGQETSSVIHATDLISTSDTFDSRFQPMTIQAATSSQTLLSLGYDFGLGVNDNGNVHGITNGKDASRNQAFTYDGVNRLASAQNGRWGMVFTYDPWGNLTQTSGITNSGLANTMPVPADRSASVQNQLLSSLVPYYYSPTGNMLTDGTGASHVYDGENRIVSANGFTYAYNGDGARVAKTSSGSATGSHGWIVISGTENSGLAANATPGSATISVTGSDGTHQICVTVRVYEGGHWTTESDCSDVDDTGTLTVTVAAPGNNYSGSVSYSDASTDESIAGALATAMTGGSSPVTASASGAVITLTSIAVGSASNYPLQVVAGADFSLIPSSSTFVGGGGDKLYDSGAIAVTVNGTTTTVPWGQATSGGTSPASLASAIASAIQAQEVAALTATSFGDTVQLASIGTGTATNWPITVSASDTSGGQFPTSFSASASNMIGGKDAGAASGTLYWDQYAESDLSGNYTEQYIFANGRRLARRDVSTGALHFYLDDHLGSSNVVVSSAGTIENESDFYPFGGEDPISQNISDQHFKFTGKERDTESGLDYFGARYYASSMGRFISPDWTAEADPVPYAELDNPQTLNLYSYVQNNPLNRNDPFGHQADPCGGNVNTCTTVTADGPALIPLLRAGGHHFVDQSLIEAKGAWNSLSGQFFRRWSTGKLPNPGLHKGFSTPHRLNSAQIRNIIDKVEKEVGKPMSKWDASDIEKAVEEVKSADGDTGAFLSHIAENNPAARTVTADVQDVMSAAKSAMNSIKANAGAIEEDVKDAVVACEEGGCPPP